MVGMTPQTQTDRYLQFAPRVEAQRRFICTQLYMRHGTRDMSEVGPSSDTFKQEEAQSTVQLPNYRGNAEVIRTVKVQLSWC